MTAVAASPSLPVERAGRPAEGPLAEIRRQIASAVGAGVWSTTPPPAPIELGGVSALRFDPPGEPAATIVHLHGGAYRVGCPEYVAPFAAAVASRCGATVICLRYRLAPEHPFPAALNDGLAALRSVSAHRDCLIVSGDSAGGGLAAGLTRLLVADDTTPAGLILLSPWLDLRVGSDCYHTNAASDPLFSREAAVEAAEQYLQGAAASDALASPLLGSVSGFPPTFIAYGAGEVLAEDSRVFAAALRRAGGPVRCEEIAGMDHVAVTRGLHLPGATVAFAAMCAFVDERVSAARCSAGSPR